MSASIFRVEYHTIPAVSGNSTADFLAQHLSSGMNGAYYLTEEAIETLTKKAKTAEEREIVSGLSEAMDEHGEFDIVIL